MTYSFHAYCSQLFSDPGDMVADFMCGHGAGAIAAAFSSRDCIAIDNCKDKVTLVYCFIFYLFISCDASLAYILDCYGDSAGVRLQIEDGG
jgi:hypothetical protein